jgi:two-component system, sensor histidine kinase RegB
VFFFVPNTLFINKNNRLTNYCARTFGWVLEASGVKPASVNDLHHHSVPAISLAWLIRLRWGAAVLQTATIGFSWLVVKLSLPALPLGLLVVSTFATNAILELFRRFRKIIPGNLIPGVFVLDTMILSGLLYFSGGPANPFSVLYLVHITLAALVLGMRWAWVMVFLSSLSYGLLFLKHVHVHELEHHHGGHGGLHLQGMWIAFTLAAGIIAFFVAQLAMDLRKRESELAEARDRAVRNEKLASLMTLSAGAAHELGTPLGTMALAAEELALALPKRADTQELLEDALLIQQQLQRCRSILDQMSEHSGESLGESLQTMPIGELVTRIKQSLPFETRTRIESFHPDISVSVPVNALIKVMVNLIRNGLESGSPSVELHWERSGESLGIVVEDHGVGIPSKLLPKIGEPFFTTKPTGKGMGLGVFLARSFTQGLQGQFSLESEAGKGTLVRMTIPKSLKNTHGN